MKQTTKNWIGAAALIFASSAVTGAVVSTTTGSRAETAEPEAFPASRAPPQQLWDWWI